MQARKTRKALRGGDYPPPAPLWKLSTRLPATSRQPSTSTKKINLNGRLTTTGGSIIMPMDISAAATTMSITRNGTKMTKPMMNALRWQPENFDLASAGRWLLGDREERTLDLR